MAISSLVSLAAFKTFSARDFWGRTSTSHLCCQSTEEIHLGTLWWTTFRWGFMSTTCKAAPTRSNSLKQNSRKKHSHLLSTPLFSKLKDAYSQPLLKHNLLNRSVRLLGSCLSPARLLCGEADKKSRARRSRGRRSEDVW